MCPANYTATTVIPNTCLICGDWNGEDYNTLTLCERCSIGNLPPLADRVHEITTEVAQEASLMSFETMTPVDGPPPPPTGVCLGRIYPHEDAWRTPPSLQLPDACAPTFAELYSDGRLRYVWTIPDSVEFYCTTGGRHLFTQDIRLLPAIPPFNSQ